MPDFLAVAALIGLAMLVWDCVEVGRNDAANLVNAVFGARVLKRRVAITIAATAVVLGATFSAPVMETARKGIFDPTVLTIQMALAIYVSVYFVDTVLLYAFSGFGMPVSTTACLVFELVGAAMFLAGFDNVKWDKVLTVSLGIVFSIAISGVGSFMVMRVFRAAIRDKSDDRKTMMTHGPWVSGAMLTWLVWFMVFKGLKNVTFVKRFKEEYFDLYGDWLVLLVMWSALTLIAHLLLLFFSKSGYKYLLPGTAILGMICMSFAFGQNDLANAASPGLAGFTLWQSGGAPDDLAALATKIKIETWALFGCGMLMACGMFTKYAQRVTRAQINTGSQFDQVNLYAPQWCKWLGRRYLELRSKAERALGFESDQNALAPAPGTSEKGKKIHYDSLRASVITGVSASVIAFASGRGLPVSTTYVAFAAVLGSGFADQVFSRGDGDTKLGRAIWVVTCWFLAPIIAIISAGTVARIIYHLSTGGLVLCILLSFSIRYAFKRHADLHEQKHHFSAAGEDDETDQ